MLAACATRVDADAFDGGICSARGPQPGRGRVVQAFPVFRRGLPQSGAGAGRLRLGAGAAARRCCSCGLAAAGWTGAGEAISAAGRQAQAEREPLAPCFQRLAWQSALAGGVVTDSRPKRRMKRVSCGWLSTSTWPLCICMMDWTMASPRPPESPGCAREGSQR